MKSRATFLLLLPACAVLACGKQDCDPIGFDQGEQFQVTIVGEGEYERPCQRNHPSFAPGDSHTITGGELIHVDDKRCPNRLLEPLPPEPWADKTSHCDQFGSDITGISCLYLTEEGFEGRVQVIYGPRIEENDEVIEDGRVSVSWGSGVDSCWAIYDARFERL